LERYHQIGESELVYARFSRQTLKRLPFETKKRAGRFGNIDRVNNQQTPDAGDVVEQTEPLRAAVEQNDVNRNARIALQPLYGVNADAVVGMNQVAKAEHEGFGHFFVIRILACSLSGRPCHATPLLLGDRPLPVRPPG